MQLSDLTNHPLFSLSGWIIGVVGLLYAIFAVKRKELFFVKHTSPIIGGEINKVTQLRILYSDIEIKRLSTTTIIIWNDGRQYLDASDIAAKAPLEISAETECRILECRLDRSSSTGSNARVIEVETNKRYRVEFDFLNSKQGCRITVLHDASSGRPILVSGEIKEGGKIVRPRFLLQRSAMPEVIVPFVVTALFGIAAGYGAIFGTGLHWLRIPLGIFSLFVAAMIFLVSRAKIIPKGLAGDEPLLKNSSATKG